MVVTIITYTSQLMMIGNLWALLHYFFFSSRRRHTRCSRDWSSDVCSSDLSVKALLLEEAYEVVDAVNSRDYAALEDELGDLLFQVVFYSRLAEEEKRFTIDDEIGRASCRERV